MKGIHCLSGTLFVWHQAGKDKKTGPHRKDHAKTEIACGPGRKKGIELLRASSVVGRHDCLTVVAGVGTILQRNRPVHGSLAVESTLENVQRKKIQNLELVGSSDLG